MASRLPILQEKQDVIKFSRSVFPPLEKGTTWSSISLAPVCGVAPQYWQVKPSLSRISNLIFRGASRFLFILSLSWKKCFLPIISNAFIIPPHFSYCERQGNPGISFISLPVTLLPFNRQASSSFCNRYSMVIKCLCGLCFFITKFITKLFTKYKQ